MTPRRILVVEDNPLNLKLVRDVLQFAGYDVVEAQSGEEGLRVAQEDPPDLVLMDLQLPGIDGTETLRRLRQGSSRPRRAGRRGHRLRDARGPGASISGRLRRLRREADQRPGTARPDRGVPRRAGAVMDIPVTVLAVDDQPTNLRLLDAVLTPRGHRVLTASSGAEALALLETEDVDLVLLDIVMPGMDGYEVCRRIRSNPATEFLPVVMITASGSEQRLAALESGADDFVTKPFDQSELLARVASLARIKRYHDTIRRQADELAEWNTELEARVAAAGRRAGADQPAAPLPVTTTGRSGRRRRDPAAEPSPRDRRGLLRSAELHPVRRDQRARGGDGRARRVPPGHRGADPRIRRHAGAVHRRRDHGVLQRPDPVRRRGGARGPDGGGHPRRRAASSPRAGAATVTTSRWESVSPKASRRSAGSASRAASTTPPSAASRISPPGCAPTPGPGRCWSPTACSRPSSTCACPKSSATCSPRDSAARCGSTTSARSTTGR